MLKPLKKQYFFMSPVQVVKVTTHNIEQAAEWCGGEIKTTESRRNPGRTDKYIDVPVPKGSALVMAFPGMYITKRCVITLEDTIKVTYAVFRKNFFEKNYFLKPLDSVDASWTRLENEQTQPDVVTETGQTAVVMNIHVASPGEVGKAMEAARAKVLESANIGSGTTVVNVMTDELSPREQRELITESLVEAATVPETANVVMQEDTRHPSKRETTQATWLGEIEDGNPHRG